MLIWKFFFVLMCATGAQSGMVGCMKNEWGRIWKETGLVYSSYYLDICVEVRYSYPCTGRGGPWGCESLRLPHFQTLVS
jgi:hypothetical protein